MAWNVAPEDQPPAPAAPALAAPALVAPALVAPALAAPSQAASSSTAARPADGQHQQQQQQSQGKAQEMIALKFLRHSQALEETAKAYSLGAALGKGTFGVVFAGTRKADNHPVAIKRLRKMTANGHNAIVAEAVILDRVRGHPHVVQLLDAFELGKQKHLVSEHGGVL